MNTFYIPIILAVVLVIGYMHLSLMLTRLMQPLRRDVMDVTASLLHDPDFPDPLKRTVTVVSESMLDKTFAWSFVIIFPIRSFMTIFGTEDSKKIHNITNSQKRAYRHVCVVGALCMFSTSPIAMLLAAIEIALFRMLHAPVVWVGRTILTERYEQTKQRDRYGLAF